MNTRSRSNAGGPSLEDLVLRYKAGEYGLGNKIVSLCQGTVRRHVFIWTRSNPEAFEDMYQEACIGIMQAVRNFDPGKGSFGTALYHAIRRELSRAVDEGVSIGRAGPRIRRRMRVVNSAINFHFEKHGEYPSSRELARLIGLSEEQVDESLLYLGITRLSFETPVTTDGTAPSDEIASESAVSAEDGALQKLLFERALRCMKALSASQNSVIAELYLKGHEPTRGEVGELIGGVSKQRVCQLEAGALDKLRRGVTSGRS